MAASVGDIQIYLSLPLYMAPHLHQMEDISMKKKYIENMSAAVEQYINRVNSTPCMNTVIHLAKGADNISIEISKRPKLLVFLKGSKAAKDTLKKENPMLYQYFSEVWTVRHNYMDNTVPGNYIFLLSCCAREGCPHLLCQSKF